MLLSSCQGDDLEAALQTLVGEVRGLDPDQRPTTDDVAAVLIRARRP